jgi:gas vesicle protein
MADHEEGYVIIERRTGNFGTFVWGMLLGAAAALLFAPKSGRETRQELTDSVHRLRDQAEDKVHEVQRSVTEAVEDVRRQFEEGIDTARRAVDSGKEAARASRAEMERHLRDSSDAFRSGFEAARAAGGTPADGGAAERGPEGATPPPSGNDTPGA